jgi:hypothetical protein
MVGLRFAMRRLVLAMLLVCGVAMPAHASVVLDFGNLSGQTNLGTTGPNGNVRTYSVTIDGNVVNVQATAWRLSGTTITNAFLGAYNGWGLGVTNRSEGGSSPGHAIDDSNGLDFVALQFDEDVILTQLGLKAVSSYDTDASIYFGTASGTFGSGLGLHNANVSVLNAMLDGGFVSEGGTSSRTAIINAANQASNLWIVTPYTGDGSKKTDLFKLRSALIDLPDQAPPVPEPATWLMMLLGFFATGAALRHRPTAEALSRAAA